MDKLFIKNKLKKLRGNMTIEEVAYKNGITYSALVQYESENRIPCIKTKVKLSDFYELTVQGLFYLEQNKKDIQS